ncbi:hypothetical protein quinque_002110 [Culex quinquefasciatus]
MSGPVEVVRGRRLTSVGLITIVVAWRGSTINRCSSTMFKNQTRNKTNDCDLPMVGPGGVAGGQVVHRNSAGALSGSVQSNKMNNAIVLPVGGVPERMLDQRPVKQHHYSNQLR